MGVTVYWMNVSMDLRIEHAPGEQGGGSWMRIDEPLHREFNKRARALSAMVQGRVIYDTMEAFWPAAIHDESLPDYLREYGAIWTNTPKVLVSRTRTKADYDTRVIGNDDDALERLRALRSETDGTIGVGGATLATQMLHAGILDEVLLFVHPVVLGTGRPLFDDLKAPVFTQLLEHQSFESGVTMLRYGLQKS